MAKQNYRSARGKEIDMLQLVKQNEMTIAVGNAKVNARGDKLGPGGTIIKTREQIVAEQTGQAVPNQFNVRAPDPVPTPAITKVPVAPPVVPPIVKKDVANQDPLGEE
jgi:hypothetical protein